MILYTSQDHGKLTDFKYIQHQHDLQKHHTADCTAGFVISAVCVHNKVTSYATTGVNCIMKADWNGKAVQWYCCINKVRADCHFIQLFT